MNSNDEFRDLLRSIKLRRVFPSLDEAKTSNGIYEDYFGLPEDNISAWTDNISNADFYYCQGKITFEITFKNDEIIICTLGEICSQRKMGKKMEEKFQVKPPMLTRDEYEMFLFIIICGVFWYNRSKYE